jgi:hypothetical protein
MNSKELQMAITDKKVVVLQDLLRFHLFCFIFDRYTYCALLI